MTVIAIRTENLTRDFETVRALDGLSLEVPAGEIFGFLGPNGAGKTTTINVLLGLLEPTEGRAEVLGFDTSLDSVEIRSRTGALLEHSGVYEHLSAEDNLQFYGRVWQMPEAERNERIKELLTQMELWDRREERSGTLSKGMKQKLALARVLLHRPELVLLDEPTAGLDVVAATAIREDLESLVKQEGVTVFLTTHNMAEAEKLCNQVAVIREGKLIAVGHPDELRARAGGPRVEIVGSGFSEEVIALLQAQPEVTAADVQNSHLVIDLNREADAAPLIKIAVGAGVMVEEVRRGAASLEDVFLTLMEEEK
ncbi:MAG: ATP-binding cassette domain-containing protein [Anaerolineales bacterium]|nr:ATP-binding cassette domain-containing protein [Anaerolineales bacterium]